MRAAKKTTVAHTLTVRVGAQDFARIRDYVEREQIKMPHATINTSSVLREAIALVLRVAEKTKRAQYEEL